MSHSARIFRPLLFAVVFHFLPFTLTSGWASDSLRVGLFLKSIDEFEENTLSKQIIQTFNEKSILKIVIIDTNIFASGKPFDIDSLTIKELQRQGFQGLISCKLSASDSVHQLTIEAISFEKFKQKNFDIIDLDRQDSSKSLLAIIRAIDELFLPHRPPESLFRIIFAPITRSNTDSSSLSFRVSLFDSLKKLSIIPQFSKIELFVVDSINQTDQIASAIDRPGESHENHLILTGFIDKDKTKSLRFHPHLEILKQNKTQNSDRSDNRLVSVKTCQISQFNFPVTSLENLSHLADFIKGYFLIEEKKYAEAIETLKNVTSFAGYYYQAESYFHQGVMTEQNRSLAQKNLDSSIFYWKKCLSQAHSQRDFICITNNIGVAFQLNGKIDSAVVYFTKANSAWSEQPNTNEFISISHNLGNIFLLKRQWKKALDIFQSTVTAMEQLGDSLNLAMTYESLGHIYQLIYQRSKAIGYYQKALELREKMNDLAGMATSYSFLGNTYHGTKDYQLATNCFKQSLALNLKIQHEPQLARTYDNLGLIFQETGKLDSALIYFQKSYETYDLLGDKNGQLETMVHQASVYQKQGVAEKAISLYERALEMIGDNNSRLLRAQIYDRLGDIYNHQNNLIPALGYYQQAADLYEPAGNFENLSLIFYNMGLIKLKQNDYAEGYQLLKRAIALDEQHGFNNLSEEKDFLDQLEGILKKN